MNHQAVKQHIEEKIQEYCLKHRVDWGEGIRQYCAKHPDDHELYITACGEQSLRTLAARFQNQHTAAAVREADDPDSVTQLSLPGIPRARLSSLVEVAPGDWRERDEVSVVDQLSHSEKTTERCKRWTGYHSQKAIDQRAMAAAMEAKDKGSSRLPLKDVRARWVKLGLFDETETDAPVATATADLTR
jgi:hypothetical protein